MNETPAPLTAPIAAVLLGDLERDFRGQRSVPLVLAEHVPDRTGYEVSFAFDQSIAQFSHHKGTAHFKRSARGNQQYLSIEINYSNYPNATAARSDALDGRHMLKVIDAGLVRGVIHGVLCHRSGELVYRPAFARLIRISNSGRARHQVRGGQVAVCLST